MLTRNPVNLRLHGLFLLLHILLDLSAYVVEQVENALMCLFPSLSFSHDLVLELLASLFQSTIESCFHLLPLFLLGGNLLSQRLEL
eukprot:XP_001707964.1 Hypothetical protein GL50803_7019 [Giardia lamblia ATCC 50803]